jgi:hypothetical protein
LIRGEKHPKRPVCPHFSPPTFPHGEPDEFTLLDLDWWRERWTARAWAAFLGQPAEADCLAIRRSTHTGRPLGSPAYVEELECRLGRALRPKPGGRPPKASAAQAAT